MRRCATLLLCTSTKVYARQVSSLGCLICTTIVSHLCCAGVVITVHNNMIIRMRVSCYCAVEACRDGVRPRTVAEWIRFLRDDSCGVCRKVRVNHGFVCKLYELLLDHRTACQTSASLKNHLAW